MGNHFLPLVVTFCMFTTGRTFECSYLASLVWGGFGEDVCCCIFFTFKTKRLAVMKARANNGHKYKHQDNVFLLVEMF